MDVRGRGERKSLEVFFCREGECKWAPSRIKASEDDPLTMKFDDPVHLQTHTEPSLTLPWAQNPGACGVKKTPVCLLTNDCFLSFLPLSP